MEIHKLLRDRWSPVAFSEEKPTRDITESLFKAASLAPSSFNAQPWKFIYGMKGEDAIYEKLFGLLKEVNKDWAYTAPVLALSLVETISPGRSTPNRYAWHDTGMAVGNLLVQATSLSLFVHQMGGFDHAGAVDVLNLPANHEPGAMMAIGYKGNPSLLPKDIGKRDLERKGRKKLDEIVFTKTF